MSRRMQSLKRTTLAFIARNINYWTEMIPDDPDNYLYLLGPFEGLDHGLTQELFDTLVKMNAFIPKHVHLLFHSQLNSIDLSKTTSFRLGENILKILLKRCKKIKNLKLSSGTRYSKPLLNLIPCCYPDLQSFALASENISDQFVFNLVKYCPNLVCFQSAACGKLTPDAYKELKFLTDLHILTLGKADALTDETLLKILNCCRKIKHLSLPMTAVNLKLFTKKHMFSSIQMLDLTLSDSIDDNSVEKIVTSCCNLKALCLSNCRGITGNSLGCIAENCKALENLNISYCGIKTFSREIQDFLIRAGHNLHSVDFSGISGMRTALFGEYCSHLEKLFLNHCPYLATEWIPHNIWQRVIQRNAQNNDKLLNEMILVGGKHEKYSLLQMCPLLINLQIDFEKKKSDRTNFDLEAVLQGGCNLQTLYLVQLPQFEDSDLRGLQNFMNIGQIQHLNISGNATISAGGIWYAVKSMVSLRKIEVGGCDIFDNEIGTLSKKICANGYDVELIGHS